MSKLIVWIFNIGVALLCILSIIGYAFGPFWAISTEINLPKEEIQNMLESQEGGDTDGIDYNAVIGDEGIDLSITFAIPADVVFNPLQSGEEAVAGIVDSSVDNIYDEFITFFKDVSKRLVKEITRVAIEDELKEKMLEYLDDGSDAAEVWQKLNDAGVTDEYISEKINGIIDLIYSGHTTVDAVNDELINTIDEVYDKLRKSGDSQFSNVELSEENKQQYRENFSTVLDTIADKDGNINTDSVIDNLLLDLFKSMNQGGGETEEQIETASVVLMAEETDSGNDGNVNGEEDRDVNEEIKTEIKNYLMDMLSDASEIIGYVLLAMFALYALSSLAWLYILIKLLVKVITIRKSEPTVKLKAPIILGWLPFLILVLVPNIAIKVLAAQFLPELPINFAVTFASVGGTIAFVSAVICFAISIFYMVVRKKNKKAKKAAQMAAANK